MWLQAQIGVLRAEVEGYKAMAEAEKEIRKQAEKKVQAIPHPIALPGTLVNTDKQHVCFSFASLLVR